MHVTRDGSKVFIFSKYLIHLTEKTSEFYRVKPIYINMDKNNTFIRIKTDMAGFLLDRTRAQTFTEHDLQNCIQTGDLKFVHKNCLQ